MTSPVAPDDAATTNSSNPTTPASSPPSVVMPVEGIEPVSEAMQVEEKRMKDATKRRQAKERQKVQLEDEEEKEAKYQKLMTLVQSSKVSFESIYSKLSPNHSGSV